jgi:hypothetical protein
MQVAPFAFVVLENMRSDFAGFASGKEPSIN